MEGYIGEVRLFAGNFAPRAWAYCHGQLMAISSNTALFSLIGTIYGGDGRTTFALPNTQSRAVVSSGQGPGLSNYKIGQVGGVEKVTLTDAQIPAHSHILINNLNAVVTMGSFNDTATSDEPENTYYAQHEGGTQIYATSANNSMGPTQGTITGDITVLNTGGSTSHTNMQPILAMSYIICIQGIFPSRN